jgi:predicted Zn-dependent protease
MQNGFTASISINRDGFKDFTGLTHTILHELGHVLRAAGFVGGQFEDNDFAFGSDGQTTNQDNNNRIIWDNCFGGKQ